MKNDWANSEAKKFIKKYKNLGFSKDIALRVYTSRLLGKNKKLVLGLNQPYKMTLVGDYTVPFFAEIGRLFCPPAAF